jgi:hypothetical protein
MHLVDREVPAHVPQELDVVLVRQPVGVVQQDAHGIGIARRQRPVGQVGQAGLAEVDEPGQLRLDARQVGVDLLQGEHLPQFGLAAGIAHHGGAAAGDGDGLVAVPLQVHQAHDGQQRPDVQAVGGGVEPDVRRHGLPGQQIGQAGFVGALLEEAAPAHLLQEVLAGTGGLGHDGSPALRWSGRSRPCPARRGRLLGSEG